MAGLKYSPVDFIFTIVGLICLLLDIVLDVVAAVSFYQDEQYVSLGLLLLFLLGSSVLVQVYSCLWYSYEGFRRLTKVERSLSRRQLKLLHVFQLGIYLRFESFLRCLEPEIVSLLHVASSQSPSPRS